MSHDVPLRCLRIDPHLERVNTTGRDASIASIVVRDRARNANDVTSRTRAHEQCLGCWLHRAVRREHSFGNASGSLFVHLDWHQGHYVKVMLDEIFGDGHFLNEIVWWYYNKLQGNINRFAFNHDVLFWYAKTEKYTFHRLREPREKTKRQQKRAWDPETKSLKQARDAEGNLVYYDETERTIDDVWRLPYLMPANTTENVRYQTQRHRTATA